MVLAHGLSPPVITAPLLGGRVLLAAQHWRCPGGAEGVLHSSSIHPLRVTNQLSVVLQPYVYVHRDSYRVQKSRVVGVSVLVCYIAIYRRGVSFVTRRFSVVRGNCLRSDITIVSHSFFRRRCRCLHVQAWRSSSSSGWVEHTSTILG